MEKKIRIIMTAAIILTMAFSILAINIPSTEAADYPTYLFLTAQPDPIGVGQTANVVYWMDKAPPTASGPRGDRWQNWKMEITSPDGDVETINLGPIRRSRLRHHKIHPHTNRQLHLQSHFPRTKHHPGQRNQLVQTQRKHNSPINRTRRTNPSITIQSATEGYWRTTDKRCKPRLERTGRQLVSRRLSRTTRTTML